VLAAYQRADQARLSARLPAVPGVRLTIPGVMPRERMQRPIRYRDRKRRVWHVSEVARLKVVSASIDGPNRCLVNPVWAELQAALRVPERRAEGERDVAMHRLPPGSERAGCPRIARLSPVAVSNGPRTGIRRVSRTS